MPEKFKITTKNPERWKDIHHYRSESGPETRESVDDLVSRYMPEDLLDTEGRVKGHQGGDESEQASANDIQAFHLGMRHDIGAIGSGQDLSTPEGRQEYIDELLGYGVDVSSYGPEALENLRNSTVKEYSDYKEERRVSREATAATDKLVQEYTDKGNGDIRVGADHVRDLTGDNQFHSTKAIDTSKTNGPAYEEMTPEQVALVAAHEDQIRDGEKYHIRVGGKDTFMSAEQQRLTKLFEKDIDDGEIVYLQELLNRADITELDNNARRKNLNVVQYIFAMQARLDELNAERAKRYQQNALPPLPQRQNKLRSPFVPKRLRSLIAFALQSYQQS